MKIRKKIFKLFVRIFVGIFILWLFFPYIQVENLTRKYGKNFEKSYTQSEWFREDDFSSIKVLRYKEECARVATDSVFVKEMMEDERTNIAVVCYNSIYIMVFQCEEGEWRLDTNDRGGENWIVLQSGTTSNVIWPFYI